MIWTVFAGRLSRAGAATVLTSEIRRSLRSALGGDVVGTLRFNLSMGWRCFRPGAALATTHNGDPASPRSMNSRRSEQKSTARNRCEVQCSSQCAGTLPSTSV